MTATKKIARTTNNLSRVPGSKRHRVYSELLAFITGTKPLTDQRLAPIKELAQRFGTSSFTINTALQRLEAEGYVETRHGSGTYITSRHRSFTMEDTVMLCLPARGHLWADFVALLMEGLADRGRLGTLLGMESTHGSRDETVRRMAHSASHTVIVEAGQQFPFDAFDLPGMRQKTVIAVLHWASGEYWDGLYRVLHDREAGARLVVDYLWDRGHRRVLVLGTPSQTALLTADDPLDICPAAPFRQCWEARGGSWQAMASQPVLDKPGALMSLDAERFLTFFTGDAPPTAVFALRDHEAWLAQNVMLQHRPELTAHLGIIGYGNTPWSEAGHPPFASVDYNFPQFTDAVMRVLDALDGGTVSPAPLILVPPLLVTR